MFSEISPIVSLIFAILDYIYKAVVNFRETDQGRAEWLDIEAAYQDVTGDKLEGEEIRAQAVTQRQTTQAVSSTRGVRAPSVPRDRSEG